MNDMSGKYGDGTAAGYKGKSGTSRASAAYVQKTLGARQAAVLEQHARYGEAGATPCQVANDLELDFDLVRPRVTELVQRKLLFSVGKREGRRGRQVVVHSTIKPIEAAD